MIVVAFGCVIVLVLTFLFHSLPGKRAHATPDGTAAETARAETDQDSALVELDDALLTKLIMENLTEELPISNVLVHIGNDGNLGLDCEVQSKELLSFLDNHKVEIPAGVRFMMKLLPDSVPVSLQFRIAIDAETGYFYLNPNKFEVSGVDLSGTLLPDELKININQAINSFFEKKNIKIGSLELQDGKLRITPAQ